MKEMMKRCLSMGFSLTVIFLSGIRNHKGTSTAAVAPKPTALPTPTPTPAPTAELLPLVSYTGTVVRDGTRFALRDAKGALFTLHSTGRAWPFEGEEVRVTGHLDQGGTLLHIQVIHATDDLRAEAV